MSLSIRLPVDATVSGTGAVVLPDPMGGAYATDDLILVVVQTAGQFTTLSVPNGFQEVTAARVTTGGTPGAAGETAIQVFWKWATAGANGCTIADAGDHVCAQIQVYTPNSGNFNTAAGQPFDAVGKATYAAGTTAHSPAITTRTGSNMDVLCIVGNGVSSTVNQMGSPPSVSNTGLSTSAYFAFGQCTDGVGGGFDVLYGVKATAGTLAADTWSYTLANSTQLAIVHLSLSQTLTITQGLTPSVAAAAGSYTETGAAATLSYARIDPAVAVPVGAFDATATSPGWFAEIGSLSWFDDVETGAAATAYTLTASAGAYTETGAAAALLAGYRAASAAGAYTETGSAAALLAGYRAAAAAGAYTETGSAVGLTRTARLAAAAGAYTETGAAAGIHRGLLVSADAAALEITGAAAALARDRVLRAYTTLYMSVGADAALHAIRHVDADAAALEITGAAAALARDRVLRAYVAAYVLAGVHADLISSRAIDLAEAEYAGAAALDSYSGEIALDYAATVTIGAYGGDAIVDGYTGTGDITP